MKAIKTILKLLIVYPVIGFVGLMILIGIFGNSDDDNVTAKAPTPATAQAAKLSPAECAKNLVCTARAAQFEGSCMVSVQSQIRFNYEWTDTFLQDKFYSASWHDKAKGIIVIRGERLKTEDARGTMRYQRYACVYDTKNKKVIRSHMRNAI